MIKTLINWGISALILWGLSFLPFMYMSFRGWGTVVGVAIVLGLINALIVPIVKGIFKNVNATLLLVISLVIDAVSLILAGWFVGGFTIEFFPTAIIAAAVLAVLNTALNLDRR